LIAVAGVTNRSPYTRFSQSGGGQLEGYAEGLPGQYRVNQLMQESAGKYRGFSWQQELHYKQILDQINSIETEMAGNLLQVGYFFHHLWKAIPKNMELYARQAFYMPDISMTNQLQNEVTFGFNWFVSGHRIKITGEASHLSSDFNTNETVDGWRYRCQLDVSF
jgi:phosphate-selective porin OprO/OprP